MRSSSFLLLLVAACSSSPTPAPVPSANDSRPVRVVATRADRAQVALEMRGSAGGRLGEDLADGRRWLSLDAPRAFSFAGADLLAGATDWSVQSASATFARERNGKPVGTTLVRVEGTAPNGAVVPVDNPNLRSEGLGMLSNQSVRVLLGRGIDSLLRRGNTEVIVWIAVVDGDGNKVKWTPALESAYREQTLRNLDGMFVLLERNDLSSRTYYRAPLPTVLLAAQSKLTRTGDDDPLQFVWEGVWRGATQRETPSLPEANWQTTPKLVYKEYAAPRQRVALLRTVFAPVALASDFGAAFLDPDADEGLFRETRDRQKSRR